MAEARQAADRERAAGVEKTRQEQEDLLHRARREIDAERERAVAEIRREAVDLAISAAGKVVGQRLDSAADRKIVEDYIESIGSGARGVRDVTIARNYAETLLALAEQHDALEKWGDLLDVDGGGDEHAVGRGGADVAARAAREEDRAGDRGAARTIRGRSRSSSRR